MFSGTVEAAAAAVHGYLRPEVIGSNVFHINETMAACDRVLVGHPEAKAAVEMALCDIAGKALGVPLHTLLGGAVRERIPLSFSIADPDLETDIALARTMYREGIRIFKVKTGFVSHREDLARLERIRAELSADVDLRIDYNQGLEPFGALTKLREMERFQLTFIEQPVARQHLDAMVRLTEALETPILADESVFSPEEALDGVRRRIADAFSIKLMKSGGIAKARRIAVIAETAGIPCYGGTLWEGAIALTAAAHMIAATSNVSLGCEFYMPRYVFESDELEAVMQVEEGHVRVSTGPGLGLDIDENVLDRLTVQRFA